MHARPLTFETGARSHVGLVRERNEDRFFVHPEIGLWAVADGMGGHDGGEIASSTVVQALQSIGYPASGADLLARFEDRINRANNRLNATSRARGGAIIGTTIAALLTHECYYACLWSGDSRVYLVRGGGIAQLSRDHTEVQELVDNGVLSTAEARSWPRQNVITRAIGIDEEPSLELRRGRVEPGDRFVICSDGLTHHLRDEEILEIVRDGAVQDSCDRLVALALERGGTDNVTVVAVLCAPGDGAVGLRNPSGVSRPDAKPNEPA